MTVEELIAKLKKCPKKAQVCWDSNKTAYWFGEDVEALPWNKSALLGCVAGGMDMEKMKGVRGHGCKFNDCLSGNLNKRRNYE